MGPGAGAELISGCLPWHQALSHLMGGFDQVYCPSGSRFPYLYNEHVGLNFRFPSFLKPQSPLNLIFK